MSAVFESRGTEFPGRKGDVVQGVPIYEPAYPLAASIIEINRPVSFRGNGSSIDDQRSRLIHSGKADRKLVVAF